jgi:hypothetical protein
VQETVREGRRPERTVYAITDPGRIELVDWLSELLAVPVKEYLRFEAALSLMSVLSPDVVIRLLEVRRTRLDADIAANDGVIATMADRGMPYLWTIEVDYTQALRRAERDFVHATIERLTKGELPEMQAWRRAHEMADGVPSEAGWEAAVREPPTSDINWGPP